MYTLPFPEKPKAVSKAPLFSFLFFGKVVGLRAIRYVLPIYALSIACILQ